MQYTWYMLWWQVCIFVIQHGCSFLECMVPRFQKWYFVWQIHFDIFLWMFFFVSMNENYFWLCFYFVKCYIWVNMSDVVVLYWAIKTVLKPIELHVACIVYLFLLYTKSYWIKLNVICSNNWIKSFVLIVV